MRCERASWSPATRDRLARTPLRTRHARCRRPGLPAHTARTRSRPGAARMRLRSCRGLRDGELFISLSNRQDRSPRGVSPIASVAGGQWFGDRRFAATRQLRDLSDTGWTMWHEPIAYSCRDQGDPITARSSAPVSTATTSSASSLGSSSRCHGWVTHGGQPTGMITQFAARAPSTNRSHGSCPTRGWPSFRPRGGRRPPRRRQPGAGRTTRPPR